MDHDRDYPLRGERREVRGRGPVPPLSLSGEVPSGERLFLCLPLRGRCRAERGYFFASPSGGGAERREAISLPPPQGEVPSAARRRGSKRRRDHALTPLPSDHDRDSPLRGEQREGRGRGPAPLPARGRCRAKRGDFLASLSGEQRYAKCSPGLIRVQCSFSTTSRPLRVSAGGVVRARSNPLFVSIHST